MSSDECLVRAPVEVVWDILCQPPRYPDFVVGTKRLRRYDPTWPAPDSRLHHTVGVTPFFLRDESTVIEVEPYRRLKLHAGLRPLGVNVVVFILESLDRDVTRLTIEEDRLEGPMKLVPRFLADPALSLRNKELLRRFRRVAEEHARVTEPQGGAHA